MTTSDAPQAPEKKTDPQEEHRWLQRLVGAWTFDGVATTGPGQPPDTFTGREHVRSLGDLWVLAEGEGETPGGIEQSVMTLGYDAQQGRYVGTWIGSMMAHLWVYDGILDAAARVLTLEAEGPSMAGDGTMATYRDVIELKDDDHRGADSARAGRRWDVAAVHDLGLSTDDVVARLSRTPRRPLRAVLDGRGADDDARGDHYD
jgi:hypothetical protein